MFLPAQYAWAEPVAIGAIVVFIAAWIGNSIVSSGRFLTALATAIVFALMFGPLAYFRLATLSITVASREAAPIAGSGPSAPQPPRAPPANPVTTVPTR